MLEIVPVVVPGNDLVPSYLDLHLRIPNSRRVVRVTDFDLTKSRVRFPASGVSVALRGWQMQESRQSLRRGYKRFVLVAPADAKLPLSAGERIELTLQHKDAEVTVEAAVDGVAPDALVQEARMAGKQAASRFDLLTAYPILTSNVPSDGTPSGPTAAVTSAKQLIAQVLGRSVRDNDQAGWLTALDRQFVYSNVDGVDVYEPRSGATAIQAGIGTDVSGAQLSLATLAMRTADEIGGLVETAQPIRPIVDNPNELEALRSNFQASWGSFVAFVGQEGGFPIVRAQVFLQQAQDALGQLGQELGYLPAGTSGWPLTVTNAYVVGADDARAAAEFQIVCDRVDLVVNAFTRYQSLESPPDYGIAIVTVERDLDVLTDYVGNVQAALASLGVSDEEQESIAAQDGMTTPAEELFLSDLLQWCSDLPEEGRSLLQDGGVSGAALLAFRATQLSSYVHSFVGQISSSAWTGDLRLAMPRVVIPFGLLDTAIQQLATDASTFSTSEGESQPVLPVTANTSR